jgi:peptidoglycan/LPS O-acetylase OafA/YrhL
MAAAVTGVAPARLTPAHDAGAAPIAAGAHVPALDGVRGLAILLVVLHNASYVPHGASDSLALKLWDTAMGAGWIGVQLFFTLSGLLITGILLDTKGRPGWLRAFYMRRVLRIFPLYYLVLAAYFVVAPLLLGRPDLGAGDRAIAGWYFAYLSNWYLPPAGMDSNLGHTWSLAVEEQFYILWPLLVLALSRRGLLRACVAVVVAAVAFRAGLHALAAAGLMPPKDAGAAGYQWTIARMDALAAGGIVAILLRADGARHALRRGGHVLAMAGVAGLLVVAALNRSFHSTGPLVQVVGQALLTAAAAGLLLDLTLPAPGGARSLPTRWLELAPLRWLGRYSYAIYVLHMLVHRAALPLVGDAVAQGDAGRRLLLAAAYGAAVLLVSCVLAVASWHLVEQPFLRLKRHFDVDRRAVG